MRSQSIDLVHLRSNSDLIKQSILILKVNRFSSWWNSFDFFWLVLLKFSWDRVHVYGCNFEFNLSYIEHIIKYKCLRKEHTEIKRFRDEKKRKKVKENLRRNLGCRPSQIPKRGTKIFEFWGDTPAKAPQVILWTSIVGTSLLSERQGRQFFLFFPCFVVLVSEQCAYVF